MGINRRDDKDIRPFFPSGDGQAALSVAPAQDVWHRSTLIVAADEKQMQ